MTRTFSPRVSLIALTAMLAAAPHAAIAQDSDTAADDESASGNQIIVTAQKIEQRALDVPITITATSGERIRELGVTDLDELSYYTPGLLIQEQSANNPGVVIRGITSDSGSAQEGPRVTLYYNGIDISRSRGSYQAIYDMERIEVVKGPQATLFGTASAVGAISLVSAKPREGFEGEVRGGYGNFNQTLVGGYVNIGSDVIAARIAGEWRTRDGYVENLSPNQERDLYAQNQLGLRASIRYTPTADFTLDIVGTYDQQRNGGTPFISARFPASAASPGGPANAFVPANLGGLPSAAAALLDDQLGLNREVYDLNLTAEYSISDNWTFTTVNGYREFDSVEVFDADGTAAPFLEFTEFAKGWQVSHEGRFAYASDKLRASAGWNLFIEDGFQNVPFATEEGLFRQCFTTVFNFPVAARPFGETPCVAADGSVPLQGVSNIPYSAVLFQNEGRNEAYSVFADVTWIPTEALELTAGVRFLDEYRQSRFSNNNPNSVLTGAPLVGGISTNGQVFTAEEEFRAVLPRFNALVRISDDVNVYGTVSKGRRSPVVQITGVRRDGTNLIANRNDVGEEIVWNYEGGIKFATGPVSASLGVYYQDYSNFQVTVPNLNVPGTTITLSAGSASNLGVEGELAVELADWFTVFGNFGFIDGGVDNDPANGNLAGSRFRLQPEWQASGGFTVDHEFEGGVRFFATPTVTHRSTIFFQVPSTALLSQGPITLVNARAGISFADDRFEIAGFIRNAFDEEFLLDAGNTGNGFRIPTFIPGEPRFYGVEVTAKF